MWFSIGLGSYRRTRLANRQFKTKRNIVSNIPFIPETAPFTAEQRQWLNGFLAGMFSGAPSVAPSEPKEPLLVLYGSQTGTAEGLAKKTAKEAEKRGFSPKVVCMEKYESVAWEKECNVLVITSTYGDGEPPDNAQAFWNWLTAENAPRLEHLRYGVLALGDTNYPAFCEFGKKCDARLAALGASRAVERRDCDIDYEQPAGEWTAAALTALVGQAPAPDAAPAVEVPATLAATTVGYSRKNPFSAKLLANRMLTGAGSQKEVRHFEIGLAGSGLTYETGDALGIFPTNAPAVVERVLQSLGCDGEEAVTVSAGEIPLRLALAKHFDITKPTNELLSAIAGRVPELAAIFADKAALKSWLHGREVSDVLADLAQPFTPPELIALLRKMAPRLYSISSSPKAHPDEVHLTVGIVRYETHGLARGGVCSTFLADRAGEVPVFVQPSHGFKLPANGDTPIIMVGPGTGIAPFRAFVEERIITGARGRNWLFFGDQRRATDFLYEDSLTAWLRDGHLARLDLAFSRDQAEKVYVQQRMIEQAGELWSWLEDGAHFYVCGDASRMAKDVDAALHKVIETAGNKSTDDAAAYVAKLKSEKRYQRDVY